MKLTIRKAIPAFAALVGLAVIPSCGGSGDKSSNPGDTLYSAELTDSISKTLGTYMGYQANDICNNGVDSLDVEEVIKGIRYIIDADTSKSFLTGINLGMSVLSQYDQLEAHGMYVDRKVMLENLEKGLREKDVDFSKIRETEGKMQSLMMEMREIYQKNLSEKNAASPEAKNNLAKGEEFIRKITAENPAVKQLPSGAGYYEVLNPGSEPKFDGDTNILDVIVEATGLNGNVVISTEGNPTPVNIRDAFPEAVCEALEQIGPGGQVRVYVPAAYGTIGQAGRVGPNELVTFDLAVPAK